MIAKTFLLAGLAVLTTTAPAQANITDAVKEFLPGPVRHVVDCEVHPTVTYDTAALPPAHVSVVYSCPR